MIDKFRDSEATIIFETADIGYWGKSSSMHHGMDENGEDCIIGMAFTEHEGDTAENPHRLIGAEELTKAANEIIDGKHVGSYLHGQCVKETLEMLHDRRYGPGYDSELCDAIVQVAYFGELIYG